MNQERVDLYRDCIIEASGGHTPAERNRLHFRDSPSFKSHSRKLAMYCDVYAGLRPSTALKLQTGVKGDAFAQAFVVACRVEAANGRSIVFRPKQEHVVRMKTLCDRMAADLDHGV